jgi:hypothetical protein
LRKLLPGVIFIGITLIAIAIVAAHARRSSDSVTTISRAAASERPRMQVLHGSGSNATESAFYRPITAGARCASSRSG